MTLVGAVGLGVVCGWLLPIVYSLSPKALVASAIAVGTVAIVLYPFAGLVASAGAAAGIATGALLHGLFLEHLRTRQPTPEEG